MQGRKSGWYANGLRVYNDAMEQDELSHDMTAVILRGEFNNVMPP